MLKLFLMVGLALAAPAVPPAVKLTQTDAGWYLTDANGMALYTYDRDTPGLSACDEKCVPQWPPLAPADAGEKLPADWSVIARADSSLQYAFRGKPLYRYTNDTHPGGSFGDGRGDAWHVAFEPIWLPAELTLADSLLGRVLADVNGMTVYIGLAKCDGDCLKLWSPVAAPWAAVANGDWTVVARSDRTKQWAYRGQALYTYVNDMASSDTRGEGLAGGWRAVVLEPAPQRPDWVTHQASDAGELLADGKGLTIYAFNVAQNQARRSNLSAAATCNDACIREFWVPVLTDAESAPVGNWTTVKNADGHWQWAYKGELLFTHTRDKVAGDITGSRFTGSRAWHPIMRSGQPMQGTGGN